MRRAHALALLSTGALTMIALSPPGDSPTLQQCANGRCTMRMTAPELLRAAELAIRAKRYDDAKMMLAALANAPELSMQTHFLTGYMAEQTGDLKGAASNFRAVLRDRPDMTRARLELANVLMREGKDQAAAHHFRLAEQDPDLPPEIARTIRSYRGILHDRKPWHVNIDAGLAPDSNINGATDARSIDTIFTNNGEPVKLTLDNKARRQSGTGEYATVSGGVRLRLSDGKAMLIDADGAFINQPGTSADDVSMLLAVGPELTLKGGGRVAVQAVGVQRWYGGTSATRGGGVRLSYQQDLGRSSRIGVQLDTRRITSGFGEAFGGWQHSGVLTYERVVRHSMVASATAFVRRETLESKTYSSTEIGGNIGIGGELPHGINAGLSGGISRALFDAPLAYLSFDRRKDWRFNARAYVGLRSLRVLGFSPSLTYTYNGINSSLPLYASDRHRLQLGLARYF
jgi:outer membrane protein